MYLLVIGPIQISRAEQCSRALVVEPAANFDVTRKWWAEGLAFQRDPFQYHPLKAFGIIASGTRCSFADLKEWNGSTPSTKGK